MTTIMIHVGEKNKSVWYNNNNYIFTDDNNHNNNLKLFSQQSH